MKTLIVISIMLLGSIFYGCAAKQSTVSTQEPIMDMVCGMNVNMEEAYKYKYNNKTYYFDSYNCKESFKMSPEKFINNKCVVPSEAKK